MKRNEVERHAPEARTDTNLPMDEAALDWLHDNHAHDLLGNHPQVIAQARAALALRARVAECVRAAAAVTGTDAEMCATEAGADTNHGVVLAALDWQAKRVADLEAELASIKRQCIIRRGHEREDLMAHGETVLCSTELVARLYDDRIEAEAHANALRDALEAIPCVCDVVGIIKPAGKCSRCSALASTPAASLAAYRAEVLEPYLKALRSIAANTCCDRCQEAAWVAKSALAAQDANAGEVKP